MLKQAVPGRWCKDSNVIANMNQYPGMINGIKDHKNAKQIL